MGNNTVYCLLSTFKPFSSIFLVLSFEWMNVCELLEEGCKIGFIKEGSINFFNRF